MPTSDEEWLIAQQLDDAEYSDWQAWYEQTRQQESEQFNG